MTQRTDIPTHRLSVSQLPPEVEQDERDFMRLLEKALQPGYTLVKRLGAGGMGSVYLARDPVLKRLVAVKVMAPSLAADPTARARFEREAQAVASISHPNVVAVYSVGALENGVPYIVMQYVEGRTMAQRLAEDGPLDARAAKRVIGEVASAIAAAHRKHIIHRDIKPANILLDEENGRSLVSDFGIAAVLERADERDAVKITHTGVVIGTPANMSPEQLLAEPITDKSDIYSLGVLGYELFLNEGPYQISSPREVMAAHLRDAPRKLSSLRPDIDPELERLLEECLAKEPDKRPAATEVEKRLAHGATVLLEWPPPGTEALGGKLRVATRFLQLGGVSFALPLVAVSAFDRTSVLRQALPPDLVLFVVSVIGFITFIVGLEGLRRFVRDARHLVASGYGWGTVLEAAADERGDTGALIAGGREYAESPPERRSRLRRNRVVAALLKLASGIIPPLGFGVGVVVGTRTQHGPLVLLSSSILLAAACLLAASAIRSREDAVLRTARTRLRTTSKLAERANQLADVWTQSFELVRGGQIGAGSRGFMRASRLLVGALVVVLATVGVVMSIAMALTAGFGVAASVAVPRFNTRERIDQIRRVAAYRAAPDSTTSALRAGQAVHAIVRNGPGDVLHAFEKRPAITIPAQPQVRPVQDPFASQEGGFPVAAFRQALRGFSVAERDFLRALADNTALEEFRIVGKAPSLDVAAAYWDIRPDAVPRFQDLPIPKYRNLTSAADANIAAAALDVAAGRRAQAEQRLRENINAGFLMIDHGRLLIETSVGIGVVKKARSALVTLYEVTGRGVEARLLAADRDPVRAGSDAVERRTLTREETEAEVRQVLLDESQPRAVRWEVLFWIFAYQPCADLHQLVFGADELHRSTYERARTSLARTASDSLLFRVFDRSSDRPPARAAASSQYDWQRHQPVARALTLLTGNRQLEACLGLFGG